MTFSIAVLLILASQRIEDVLGWDYAASSATKRGATPSLVESCILAWVCTVLYCTVLCCTVLICTVGGRPHLVGDQAAVGRRPQGVHQRHVERRGLHHKLPLRRNHRAQNCRLLRCMKTPSLDFAVYTHFHQLYFE